MREIIFGRTRRQRRTTMAMLILRGLLISQTGVVIGLSLSQPPWAPAQEALFILFILLGAATVLTGPALTERLAGLVELATFTRRRRMLQHLRRLQWHRLEEIGHARVMRDLTTTCHQLSRAALSIARVNQVAALVAFALIALALMSLTALGMVLLLCFVVLIWFLISQDRLAGRLRAASRQEQAVQEGVSTLLAGARELRLHQPKGAAAFDAELVQRARSLRAARQRVRLELGLIDPVMRVMVLALAAACLYLLPLTDPAAAPLAIVAVMIAALFPVNTLRDLPDYVRAATAMASLDEGERTLAQAAADAPASTPAQPLPTFASLALEDAVAHYRDPLGERSFTLGPLSLAVPAGQICLLVGPNGSGKSTAMRLLTGLMPLAAGRLLVNGAPVDPATHRALFTPVFSDVHLFDRLYGYGDIDPAFVEGWLRRLRLEDKTRFGDGAFSALDLSTGQRKRLALIAALAEDRPLLILDEWAAEQDPRYRAWYYEEFMPDMKRAGKTIIAVSHDDRYFHCADQLIHLADGRRVA